ncbi:hypothetical protein ACKI1K_23805 [Streptomyces scabiei]|uniref:hypothetical protein n=1 Tax=Streptomyces scabiei TaxID=1930 RepID=UPI0002F3109F
MLTARRRTAEAAAAPGGALPRAARGGVDGGRARDSSVLGRLPREAVEAALAP